MLDPFGQERYETVLMFSHKAASVSSMFYTIRTAGNHSITATAGHYLWVVNTGSTVPHIVAAANIVVGDHLLVAAAVQDHVFAEHLEQVTAVSKSTQQGLFNPHTQSGSIVVDNIAALTFTTSIPASLTVHSALMAPIQLLHCILPATTLTTINNMVLASYFEGMNGLARMIKSFASGRVFTSIVT